MDMRDQDQLRRYVERITRRQGGLEGSALAAEARPHGTPEAAGPRAEAPAAPPGGKAPYSDALREAAESAWDKLRRNERLTPIEVAATEALIIPDKRPAFDVVDGDFEATHPLWGHLTRDAAIHARLLAAIPRIGRIELPGQSDIPYAGTGFIVGPGLLMTNRHVAEIFARGLGTRQIRFRTGVRASLDLRQERNRPAGPLFEVRGVRMIHPWWDMALLEVEGLSGAVGSLTLSVVDARQPNMAGHEVAIIGYPAYDPLRNDPDIQDVLFDRTYGVKRLQPGEVDVGQETESFGKMVAAATHDCSTLGGNSGSAIVDLTTGEVLGLHFGGLYRRINYAVPAAELARDGRVRDAGVEFAGPAPSGPAPDWLRVWNDVEAMMLPDDPGQRVAGQPRSPSPPGPAAGPPAAPPGRIVIEVPLRITIELGGSVQAAEVTAPVTAGAESPSVDTQERLVEPEHDTSYGARNGYDPNFLGLAVPMPGARDPGVLAPLRDGGTELRYQNFSTLMHARRRLALVTASNVTKEPRLRRPEPGDYSRKGLTGLGPNDREKWFLDPRLDARYQLPDAFFTNDRGAFDKGHITRREDVTHGPSYVAIRRANGDTFHVTNCSPQVAQFNQSARGEDNWGDLENLVLAEAASERLAVFAGPVLDPADEVFLGRGDGGEMLRVQVPARYWKAIVARTARGIAAYGFVLEQDLSAVPLEFTVSENFRRLQVPLAAIGEATGVDFGEALRKADSFDGDRAVEMAWRGGLRRRETLLPEESPRPTPNAGDDEEAEPGSVRVAPRGMAEAPPRWRVAHALDALRRQVDAKAPHRSRASDGTIGDAAHAARNSDHNPWVVDGDIGVVTAMDITHDPSGGCDAGVLAQAIVSARDLRAKYVIWNRQIANHAEVGGAAPWAWRPYAGRNPHVKHVHISVRPDKAAYDDQSPWPA